MPADARFVGVDAGGSTTTCVVGDAERLLGRGEAGCGNPSLVGLGGFRTALEAAFEAATHELGTPPLTAAWLGVAGSERPDVRAALREVAADVLGTSRIEVSHDARLLLAAAGVDYGVGLVAGTGSSAYGLARDGRQVRAGGWGHLLGDEGSGHDIAVQGLRAVTAAADGRGPTTRLVESFLTRLCLADPSQLVERLYPAPPVTEVAALATTVLETADAGDPVAAAIVDRAARELATLAEACAAQLAETRPLPLVAAGGLLTNGSTLRRRLAALLAGRPDTWTLVPMNVEPAVGALALARAGPHRDTNEPPATRRVAAHSRPGGVP